ncbi:hypothetical protein LTR37_014087 [Vermiconidia calcicola]|uniref:Uncharacterized protein n=1 Tax=Vermiconidia calcicola TaxID=1690605 RepID=A0ACC3MV65_9PEZI|nr:hypothetical protein LTR37_014087 [Vermiconidia calcicola]
MARYEGIISFELITYNVVYSVSGHMWIDVAVDEEGEIVVTWSAGDWQIETVGMPQDGAEAESANDGSRAEDYAADPGARSSQSSSASGYTTASRAPWNDETGEGNGDSTRTTSRTLGRPGASTSDDGTDASSHTLGRSQASTSDEGTDASSRTLGRSQASTSDDGTDTSSHTLGRSQASTSEDDSDASSHTLGRSRAGSLATDSTMNDSEEEYFDCQE